MVESSQAPKPLTNGTAGQVSGGLEPSPQFRDSIIAIVGRPNVGKSSLFNRIVGHRQAIVSDIAGTTRDRLIAEAQWEDHSFILVDTGGLEPNPEGQIREKVQEQADMALADADVIVFVADVNEGVTPIDHMLADRLRRTDKPVVLAVNKVDNDSRELAGSEFYQLGIADPMFISAFHNFGIHDLMEEVLSYFRYVPRDPVSRTTRLDDAASSQIKLSIVGRTNVGKSQLINRILGQERSIVSQVAGTTRDALDTSFTYEGKDLVLIDTAGIRRPGKVERGIEQYSVIRAVNAVNRSDITLLVTDATELATAQDAHIAGLAWELCRGLMVVVNKWDLDPDGGQRAMERAAAMIRQRFHFMTYLPIFFTSALLNQRIGTLMNGVIRLSQERLRRVPQRELQYALASALADHMPPQVKGGRGKRARFNRLEQVGVNPPTFQFTVDNPKLVHFSYQRFLENRLRTKFGFDHTHLKLVFISK